MHKPGRFSLAIVGVLGCAADPEGDGLDDGKGDGGGRVEIIQSNNPFYWATSNYEDYYQISRLLGLDEMAKPLPDSDALTLRLQGWVDKLDAVARAEVQATFGEALVAPKPIVKVVPAGTMFNAFASGTLACTGALEAGATSGTTLISQLRHDTLFHGSTTPCVRPSYPDAAELRAFWQASKPDCVLDDNMGVGGEACDIVDDVESEAEEAPTVPAGPGELAVFSVSNYLHVSSDLIAASSEPAIVFVMAHELAHYYRAHSSEAALQNYDFWYETELSRKKMPVPSAIGNELQRMYQEVVDAPEVVGRDVQGAYSPRFRKFLVKTIATLLAERTEASFVCAAARDAVGPWTRRMRAKPSRPTITSYLAFEQKLAACAPRLAMGAEGSATSLRLSTILFAAMKAKLPPATFPLRGTLADVLDAYDAKLVELDRKEAALLDKVRDNRIGLYTKEQEADNLALRLATSIGMSGEQVLDAWRAFMTAMAASSDAYRGYYEAEVAKCEDLYAREFTTTDASGARVPEFVPLGFLSDPHHSECYRLFNLWREHKLHRYQPASPLVFADDWESIRTRAKTLSEAAAAREAAEDR